MRKRVAIISNLCIVCVLVGLGVAVFTTDLSRVFLSVGAPVYNGNRDGNKVSLMFVVEDDARYVPDIMQKLKDNDAGATFFVGGKWASSNRTLTMDIARNFEIANHAYNNTNLAKLKQAEQQKEIQNCHSLVKAITASAPLDIEQGNKAASGTDMKLFSPPLGSFNKNTLKSAERIGYKTVIWSREATETSIFDKATNGVSSGDLVLMRPAAATLGALQNILDEYARLGFSVVKVSDNIG